MEGAYGAGGATGNFDFKEYVKKPQVICRGLGVLFSIIVFSCISSQGYYKDQCQFDHDPHACSFGITIGVISFLGLLCFLVVDALFDNMSSVQSRKYAVIADIIYSGLWAFMWFVCFCYLTDKWRKTPDAIKPPDNRGKSDVQAAIAFSFFSIIVYTAITAMAIVKYKAGVTETFMPRSEFDADYNPPQTSGGYSDIGGSSNQGPFVPSKPSSGGY